MFLIAVFIYWIKILLPETSLASVIIPISRHEESFKIKTFPFFLDFSISIIWDRNFFPKRWVSLSFRIFLFSLSMAFTLIGSFVIIFKMLGRRVYETEREAWLSNKIASSAKVKNLSTSISTVTWDGALRMSSNPFMKGIKGSLLRGFFPKIFPSEGLMSWLFVKITTIW